MEISMDFSTRVLIRSRYDSLTKLEMEVICSESDSLFINSHRSGKLEFPTGYSTLNKFLKVDEYYYPTCVYFWMRHDLFFVQGHHHHHHTRWAFIFVQTCFFCFRMFLMFLHYLLSFLSHHTIIFHQV
jgi:hypothetical protein